MSQERIRRPQSEELRDRERPMGGGRERASKVPALTAAAILVGLNGIADIPDVSPEISNLADLLTATFAMIAVYVPIVHAIKQKFKDPGYEHAQLNVDPIEIQHRVKEALTHFEQFMETSGHGILESGTDREIGQLLSIASRVTVWQEYLLGTGDDPANVLKTYPAFQLHRKATRKNKLLGAVPIARAGSEGVKTQLEITAAYGNGFLVEHGGRVWLVTNKHVAKHTPGEWIYSPKGADVAVSIVEDPPADLPTLRLPEKKHSFGSMLSVNPGRMSTPEGLMQFGAVRIPCTPRLQEYLLSRLLLSGTSPPGHVADALLKGLPAKQRAALIRQHLALTSLRRSPEDMYVAIAPPGTMQGRWREFLSSPTSGSSGSPLISLEGSATDRKACASGVLFGGTMIGVDDLSYDVGFFYGSSSIKQTIEHALSQRAEAVDE